MKIKETKNHYEPNDFVDELLFPYLSQREIFPFFRYSFRGSIIDPTT